MVDVVRLQRLVADLQRDRARRLRACAQPVEVARLEQRRDAVRERLRLEHGAGVAVGIDGRAGAEDRHQQESGRHGPSPDGQQGRRRARGDVRAGPEVLDRGHAVQRDAVHRDRTREVQVVPRPAATQQAGPDGDAFGEDDGRAVLEVCLHRTGDELRARVEWNGPNVHVLEHAGGRGDGGREEEGERAVAAWPGAGVGSDRTERHGHLRWSER